MNKKLFFSVAMALALNSTDMYAAVNLFPEEMNLEGTEMVIQKDNVGKYICQRPKEKNRLFKSDAVEKKIKEIWLGCSKIVSQILWILPFISVS